MNWPNWTGEPCAIIASGPSAKRANVGLLKGRMRVIAIKKNIEIAPFADVVYGCDAPWWRSVHGLPKFQGLKLAYDGTVCGGEYGIRKVDIEKPASNDLMFDEVGKIGAGGNSGFQALNLALQFGADRILLIGFDMHGRSGEHWYGRNNWAMCSNPTDDNYRRWMKAFAAAAPKIAERGATVVNASPISDLQCFQKMTIEQALDTWGLQIAA
ncbi:hypothetical protein ABIA95_000184 [Bradyrhizobium sp. LA8.1]|uniref:hypothetical protein n=1 Tax=unclassified Bradyrhizobium TaxID=2631580 RepID=UPI00339A9B72